MIKMSGLGTKDLNGPNTSSAALFNLEILPVYSLPHSWIKQGGEGRGVAGEQGD